MSVSYYPMFHCQKFQAIPFCATSFKTSGHLKNSRKLKKVNTVVSMYKSRILGVFYKAKVGGRLIYRSTCLRNKLHYFYFKLKLHIQCKILILKPFLMNKHSQNSKIMCSLPKQSYSDLLSSNFGSFLLKLVKHQAHVQNLPCPFIYPILRHCASRLTLISVLTGGLKSS